MTEDSSDRVVVTAVSKRVRDGDTEHTLLDNVSLTAKRGEWIALLGPSGSGKSTLLSVMGALDPDYTGNVRVCGEDIATLNERQRAQLRNQQLGFVFQAYNLLTHLTAVENVLLPARFSRTAADPARAKLMLERVGLGNKTQRLPSTLSGGERQRVAIARALYVEPKLMLCDEPTGNLDRATGAGILELFGDLVKIGVTLVVATHDDAIAQLAHRTVQLNSGRLSEGSR